jgi:hypothetical protein
MQTRYRWICYEKHFIMRLILKQKI